MSYVHFCGSCCWLKKNLIWSKFSWWCFFFLSDCGSDSPGKVQEVSTPGGGGCRDAGRAWDLVASTHQAVVKDTGGQIWHAENNRSKRCTQLFIHLLLWLVWKWFCRWVLPATQTHLAPSSSSSPAQREGTASAEPPGCVAGWRPAVDEPQLTEVWRVRRWGGERLATSSSWPPGSRSCWRRWRRRPAGASGRCRRSAGSGAAERRAPPRCTPPWCQRRSNLRHRERSRKSAKPADP